MKKYIGNFYSSKEDEIPFHSVIVLAENKTKARMLLKRLHNKFHYLKEVEEM